jgi:hypothetical protein
MDGGGIENFEAVPCQDIKLQITNYKIQTKEAPFGHILNAPD